MNVLIVTFGSRGDVQPYVALGKGLKKVGHEVTVCTAEQFEPFIAEQDLNYGYMSGELLKLIETDAGREALEETVGLLGSIKSMAKLTQATKPLNRQMMIDSWQTALDVSPDIVIYHPKALAAVSIAESFNVPAVMAILQPMYVPTAEFPLPGLPALPLGGWYNKLTYKSVPMGMRMYTGMVNEIRGEEMGLDPFPKGTGLTTTAAGQPIPVLHGFSRHVVPPPADWPDYVHVPGYWFLDRDEEWQPSAELEAFLDAGEPPVYVGFGSMAGKDPARLAQIVVEALQQAGARGILASGWGGLEATAPQARTLPDTILQIDRAPHDWLFPRTAAVVHHGGAGTTGAGLRAGRPTIVCPFMGDQPYWGDRVHAIGAGPKPIPQKKLTAGGLATMIRMALRNDKIRETAAMLGENIQAEDGVSSGVAIIENLLAGK